MKKCFTLENLCTRTAQSSRGVRSRRVHKIYYFGLLWSILWASTLQLLIFTMFFFIWNYCLGIIVHSGPIRAFKFKNQQSTRLILASQLGFMCLKCVQWLISVLFKSSIIMLCHQIMKNTHKWRIRKFEMFLSIICEVASHFSSVRKFWVVKWTVPYVECLNMLCVLIRQAVTGRSRWEHERF